MWFLCSETEREKRKTYSTSVRIHDRVRRKERTGILARLENSELDARMVLVHLLYL